MSGAERRVRGEPITVCSVITKDRLAYARVLARSVDRFHPGSRCYVLLADRPEGRFDPAGEPFTCLPLEALEDRETIRRMSFYYTQEEFPNALKVFLCRHLFAQGAERLFFLDSDVQLFSPLGELWERLAESDVLLIPNVTRPADAAEAEKVELRMLLPGGLYIGAFFGVRRSEGGESFLRWMTERMKWFAYRSPSKISSDQIWLNLAPLFFKGAEVISDPGACLSPWNLWLHRLTEDNGSFRVDGAPLKTFHFSYLGRQFLRTPLETAETYWKVPPTRRGGETTWGPLGKLREQYGRALAENGLEETSRYPYAFGRFPSGRPISPPLRWLYYWDCRAGLAGPRSPFECEAQLRRRVWVNRIKRRLRFPAGEVRRQTNG